MRLKKKTKLIISFIIITALCIGVYFVYKEIKRNIEYKKVFKELSNKMFCYNNPGFKNMYYDEEEFIYELELKDDGTYNCYVYSDIIKKGEPRKGKWEISYYNDGLLLRSNDSGLNCSGHYNIIDNNTLEGTSPDNKNMKLYTKKGWKIESNRIDSIIDDCKKNPDSEECKSLFDEDEEQVEEKEKIISKYKSFCIDKAEKAVKNKLKAPSTAKFSDIVVIQANSDGCNIKGKVDSQNSYGALNQNGFIYFVDSKNQGYVEFVN